MWGGKRSECNVLSIKNFKCLKDSGGDKMPQVSPLEFIERSEERRVGKECRL